MYVGLFWVSMLLASWLWVAAAAAFLGRIRPAWLRIASLILFFLVPSALLASLVLLAGFWKFSLRVEDNWFAYFTSLAAAYLIAGILIIYRTRGIANIPAPPVLDGVERPVCLVCLPR